PAEFPAFARGSDASFRRKKFDKTASSLGRIAREMFFPCSKLHRLSKATHPVWVCLLRCTEQKPWKNTRPPTGSGAMKSYRNGNQTSALPQYPDLVWLAWGALPSPCRAPIRTAKP